VSRLVFLDFETTGLDPAAGAEPIELAAVVTDDAFQELGAMQRLIRPMRPVAQWDPVCVEMHGRSGLGWQTIAAGIPLTTAGRDLTEFLYQFAPAGPLHLAGNSVHFDRSFLKHYFPDVEHLFHHRHLDVSSIRMLGERVTTAPQLGGEKPHRAMEDVRRSIAELRYWTAAIRDAALTRGP
jgi:oligoribonuclease